jgi:hypothetical protein
MASLSSGPSFFIAGHILQGFRAEDYSCIASDSEQIIILVEQGINFRLGIPAQKLL